MLKKLAVVFSLSSLLYGGNVDVSFNETQLETGKWTISFNKNQFYKFSLPVDIDFNKVQERLSGNEAVYLFIKGASGELVQAQFGVSFYAQVKITPSEIIYRVRQGSSWVNSSNSYSELKKYLTEEIRPQILNSNSDDTEAKLLDVGYIPYLEKIKANGVYTIYSQNSDFSFNINLPSGSISDGNNGSNDGNTSDGNTSIIALPPSPPAIQ